MNAAFTLIAQNYLPLAVVLAKSMKKNNPNIDFYICIVDELNEFNENILIKEEIKFKVVNENVVKDIDAMRFYYDVTEYCTSVKPHVFRYFFSLDYEKVAYLDPDIFVYENIEEPVFKVLEDFSCVLTPHICSSIEDDMLPGELIHLRTGTYNLGFIALRNDEIGKSIVDWWIKKCENYCFNDNGDGLFVDQKWMNLVVGMFDKVNVSRCLGLNIAYWNFHERNLDEGLVNKSEKIYFIHFSGFVLNDISSISKYQNRYSLSERPDLEPYFVSYEKDLLNAKKLSFKNDNYPYLNYRFSNKKISLIARRVYFWNKNNFPSPFLSEHNENEFLLYLKSNGIKEEFNEVDTNVSQNSINSKAKKINKVLNFLLRIIGPNKYASLLKYFGFISVMNNQRFVIYGGDVVSDKRKHLKR